MSPDLLTHVDATVQIGIVSSPQMLDHFNVFATNILFVSQNCVGVFHNSLACVSTTLVVLLSPAVFRFWDTCVCAMSKGGCAVVLR